MAEVSQFTVEPYVKAWLYRNCNQVAEQDFIPMFLGMIDKYNVRVEAIKDLVMIYQQNRVAGNGNNLIDAIVEKYPKYAKMLFTTRISVLGMRNDPDMILTEADEYEKLYGRDKDSTSAKLNAFLMKGYEKYEQEITSLMALLEEMI